MKVFDPKARTGAAWSTLIRWPARSRSIFPSEHDDLRQFDRKGWILALLAVAFAAPVVLPSLQDEPFHIMKDGHGKPLAGRELNLSACPVSFSHPLGAKGSEGPTRGGSHLAAEGCSCCAIEQGSLIGLSLGNALPNLPTCQAKPQGLTHSAANRPGGSANSGERPQNTEIPPIEEPQ